LDLPSWSVRQARRNRNTIEISETFGELPRAEDRPHRMVVRLLAPNNTQKDATRVLLY